MALRIGDILLEKKIVSPRELKIAVEEQKKTKEMLGDVLVRMGLISEKTLLEVLAEQQGVPLLNLKETEISENAVKSLPARFAWRYKVMPVKLDGNALTIATSNPFDMWPLDDIEASLGYRVENVLALSSDIINAIKEYYGLCIGKEASASPAFPAGIPQETALAKKQKNLEEKAKDVSVTRLLDKILKDAVDQRATDVHLECFKNRLSLRYRIDGILTDRALPEQMKGLYEPVITRLKMLSNLEAMENRRPQAGRARMKIGGQTRNLHISVMLALYGENAVIKISPGAMPSDKSDLGVSPAHQKKIEEFFKKPQGLLFVIGPPGSGKRTTLYACLNALDKKEKKVVTVEDSIEREIDGVLQFQVNPGADLTFARIFKNILRHDPDAVLAAGARDPESIEGIVQAAYNGHLVFADLCAYDTTGAIGRLIDMGISPYALAESLDILIAQRLVRLVCRTCGAKTGVADSGLPEAGEEFVKEKERRRGEGCEACNYTGYAGRTGIFEILLMDGAMRELVAGKAPLSELRKKAIAAGMKTLRQDGWKKVVEGKTTPEEVARVTKPDID